jgi:hypothetical protein
MESMPTYNPEQQNLSDSKMAFVFSTKKVISDEPEMSKSRIN